MTGNSTRPPSRSSNNSRVDSATGCDSALARLQQRASEAGWRCLADTWAGHHTRYAFECAKGHRFERHPRSVMYAQPARGCPDCRRDARRERWLATVAARGGQLAQGTFTGLTARYRLRCAAGHEWEAQGRTISEGSWCPSCAHEATSRRQCRQDGLALLQAAAEALGGQCLADSYVGTQAKYRFRCAAGHEWSAVATTVRRGHWCARCAKLKQRSTIGDMQALAARRGGLCLSSEYLGKNVRLTWQCHRGHVWDSRPVNLGHGKWCPSCALLDRVLAKNNWKRRRYLTTDKLDILPEPTTLPRGECDQEADNDSASTTRSMR